MAIQGRNASEIMLKAVVPGVAFTLTTSNSDTTNTTIRSVTVQENRPAQFKPLTQDDLVVNGIRIRPSQPGDDIKSIVQPYSSDRASSALAIAAAINSHSNETGVRALANGASAKGMVTVTSGIPATEDVANYTVYVNGVAIDVEFKKNEPELDRRTKVVNAINTRTGQHGVTALDNGYGINLETDGRNLSVWYDANISGLSAAHFGLDTGDAVAQQTRLTVSGGGASSSNVKMMVNGIEVTVPQAATAAETASALATAINSTSTITNIQVERSGNDVVFTSRIAGTPFEVRAIGMSPASATTTSLAVVAVVDNSMGSNLVTSIRGTTDVPAADSRMAKTAYGTVRLISDAALLPNLPSPVGAPPSDREALLRASSKPFTVKVGVDGFGVNGNFTALGFQEGAFGGRSSEAMDPPKVGRLAFQVGSSAQQLITIDLADFGKNGDITASITGDVDLNVEQRSSRINTRDGANSVLQLLDEVMDKINATRAQMGAVMNRLQYAMDNLSNVSMNQEASRSQIQDADYAKASTEMAKSQIMQQAATAVLAQANMSQQTVLQLLQG
jgi:flagellin